MKDVSPQRSRDRASSAAAAANVKGKDAQCEPTLCAVYPLEASCILKDIKQSPLSSHSPLPRKEIEPNGEQLTQMNICPQMTSPSNKIGSHQNQNTHPFDSAHVQPPKPLDFLSNSASFLSPRRAAPQLSSEPYSICATQSIAKAPTSSSCSNDFDLDVRKFNSLLQSKIVRIIFILLHQSSKKGCF
jgi:hypothetical protein